MKTFTCECCGKTIPAGELTDMQAAVVGALGASLKVVKAAGETRLKSVFTPAVESAELGAAVLGHVLKSATAEQHVAIAWFMEHAAAVLKASPGPS